MNNPKRLDNLSAKQIVIGAFLQSENLRGGVINYILTGDSIEDLQEPLEAALGNELPLLTPLIDTLTHVLTQKGGFFHVIRQIVQILNRNGAQIINADNISRYLNVYEATMQEEGTFRYMNLSLSISIYKDILSKFDEILSAEEKFAFNILAGNNPNEVPHQLSRDELRVLFEIGGISDDNELLRAPQLLNILIEATTSELQDQLFIQISNLLTFIENQNLINAAESDRLLNEKLRYTIFRSAIDRKLYNFADRFIREGQLRLLEGGYCAFSLSARETKTDVLDRIWDSQTQENIRRAMLKSNSYAAFKAAAEHGHTEVLQSLWEKAGLLNAPGLLNVQRVMLENNNYAAFKAAAEHGHTEVLQSLWEKAGLLNAPGLLNVQRVMLENNNYVAFRVAAQEGHTEVLQFLWERAGLLNAPGLLNVQRVMLENNNYVAFRVAAQEGHTEVLQFLWERAGSPNAQRVMLESDSYAAFRSAVDNNNINLLTNLWEKASQLGMQHVMLEDDSYAVFKLAAEQGHIEVLEFLLGIGEPLGIRNAMLEVDNYIVFKVAVQINNINLLTYLWTKAGELGVQRAMLVAHDYVAFSNAAKYNNADALDFLWKGAKSLGGAELQRRMLEVGDYAAFSNAAKYDNADVLYSLWKEAGSLGGTELQRNMLEANDYVAFSSAAEYENTDVLDFLWGEAKSLGGAELQHNMLAAGEYAAFKEAVVADSSRALEYLWNVAAVEARHEMIGDVIEQLSDDHQALDFLQGVAKSLKEEGEEGLLSMIIRVNDYELFQLYAQGDDPERSRSLWKEAESLGGAELQHNMLAANDYKALASMIKSSELVTFSEALKSLVDTESVVNSHFIQEITIEDWRVCLKYVDNHRTLDWIWETLIPHDRKSELSKPYQKFKQKFEDEREPQCKRLKRSKRDLGFCVDSRDEEDEYLKEEKEQFIKKLFDTYEMRQRAESTEFHNQLFKLVKQVFDDEVVDQDIEDDFIVKFRDIDLDLIDPEIRGVIREVKGKVNGGEVDKEEIRDILKRSEVTEKIEKAAKNARITYGEFLNSREAKTLDIFKKITGNTEAMSHLNRIGKLSGWAMHGTMYKNLIGNILNNNAEGIAINLGFIGGSYGLGKLTEVISEKGAVLIADGKLMLGRSLKAASPFLGRVTSAFIVYDLVNQVKAYKSGNKDAIVNIVGDSIILTTDAAEIGVEIAETVGVLEGISSVTGPIGAALGAVIFIGTDVYIAVRIVGQEDKIIHLTGKEKFVEGLRAFLGIQPEQYLEQLIQKKQVNNLFVKNGIEFLKNQTSIKNYIFPTVEKVIDHCHTVASYVDACRCEKTVGAMESEVHFRKCNYNYDNYFTCTDTKEKMKREICDNEIQKGLDNTIYLDKKVTINANSGLREEESIGNRRLFGFHGIGNKSREDMNQKISKRSMASMLNF